MINWSTCRAVESNPYRVSGAWVFRGTRIPIAALFENLEGGATLTEFVDWFPGVELDQVKLVLEHAAQSSLASTDRLDANIVRSRHSRSFVSFA